MPKSSGQKLKPLYLMKILLEQTDDEHTMTVPQMLTELSRVGIAAERKSIYDDLEALRTFGIDITCTKGKTVGYFVSGRDFQLPELRILADSVASSKFLTEKKSNELIEKISALTGKHEASKIKRQVYVANRVKNMNERIYYNIDSVHQAIAANRQITFKYFRYNILKERTAVKNEKYTLSPYALVWSEEHYYLVGYYEKYKTRLHFRLDRMDNCEIIDEPRIPPPADFDIAEYCKRHFSMFGADEVSVELKFHNSLINPVLDKFGRDVAVRRFNDDCFSLRVNIAPTPTFFGWLFQFSGQSEILSPENVRMQAKEHLEKILLNY